MDLRKLKTLIDLVSESNISELEITEAEGKVRIVKAALPAPATPAPAPAPGAAEVSRAALAAASAATDSAEESGPVCKIIKSPMVGTFYRASGPSAKPFIELGDSIKQGEPVCIIEAMKIMNEIEADCDGKVVRILCENGQAVEFGQPLFSVE
jgi:acetyl-CoA carboxylase biotin carboxyl carrier protein